MNPKLECVRKLLVYLPLLLLALVCVNATGQSVQVNFANPVVTTANSTPAAGVWYIDRFAPCGFSSPDIAPDGTRNTLEESICTAAFQTPTPSFYDTQGRDYLLIANTYSMSIQLYVPSSWQNENARMAGFWGAAVDSSGNIGDYPIIEFQGPITSELPGPGYYSNGGVAGFYGWNNAANSGNGGWDYIGLPPGFRYNSWVKLTITLVPGVGFEYSVADPWSRHGVSISSPTSAAPSDPDSALSAVLLQGYNYDMNYNIFWNNFTMSSSSLTCSVRFGPSRGPGRHRPW
ncbi:MAG: hypothetical protein ABSF23_02230 [Terracidiphilus sp.]|jgi:hypothetical protein